MSVVARGNALYSGFPGSKNTFQIQYTDDIEVNKIEVGLRGPVRPEIAFDSQSPNLLNASYKVEKPGNYELWVKYDNQHIPGSPYSIKVY